MNKKLLFVVLVLLSTVPLVFAGVTGKIAGKVTDAQTGEPLVGVNVILEGTTTGAATDIEGDYFIINVPPGSYTVVTSMIGYTNERKTDVAVSVDRTFVADFALKAAVIEGEEITVVSERDVIAMDRSASAVSLAAADVKEIPTATSVEQVINLQVGVDLNRESRGGDTRAEIEIRGGGRGQTELMVDGLTMVDNRSNRPMMMVNLSSIQEVNVVKGGFDAEYGNVRSGLINIVTKEGSPTNYSGSLDARITPAKRKHFGESIFDPNNYFLRPFLDPDVAFVGTKAGWDEGTQARYREWQGWDAFAADREGLTAEEAQKIFIWRHMADVPNADREPGKYGDKPDWNGEVSLGGPIPVISKPLGDLTFFGTHRTNKEAFALPTNRDYYQEQNTHLKLTSRLSSSMKVVVEGIVAETNTVQSAPRGSGLDAYMIDGIDILFSPVATGNDYSLGANGALYYPGALNRFDIHRSMAGFAFDHVLSPSTFYSLRVSMTRTENDAIGPDSSDTKSNRFRNNTPIITYGNVQLDEVPLGYGLGINTMFDGMSMLGEGSVRDYSTVNTINAKFDLTSQVNKYHQVKLGLIFNYDDLDTHYEHNQIGDAGNNWVVEWKRQPYRLGAYIQDKLEFKGMIANVGLRADMNFPNSEAFGVDEEGNVDRYSQYFRKKFSETFQELAPRQSADNHIKLSPRLGISHPISDIAKLYFNYGHFYSVPTADEMFEIRKHTRGLQRIGNPSLDLARTVAYELGVEYSISDMFLIHASGYYKDVTDQIAFISYTGFDGGVSYDTPSNNNYEDIRGFEFRVQKRFGRWITGWANYNYLVETLGRFGRQAYYEDARRQEQEGLSNPIQDRPLARPVARANITFTSPNDFGPTLGSFHPFGEMRLDLLYQWRAGRYESTGAYQNWNPVGDVDDLEPLRWKGRTTFDLRLRKNINIQRYDLGFYLDIANVFNIKYLEEAGFATASDRNNYMRSLRLPRYNGDAVATKAEYEAAGFIAGDDKPGDVNSSDKPYINMPNRGFLTHFEPRTVTFGLQVNF
jgi:outer membrane receptor protein involved in Fe transport